MKAVNSRAAMAVKRCFKADFLEHAYAIQVLTGTDIAIYKAYAFISLAYHLYFVPEPISKTGVKTCPCKHQVLARSSPKWRL